MQPRRPRLFTFISIIVTGLVLISVASSAVTETSAVTADGAPTVENEVLTSFALVKSGSFTVGLDPQRIEVLRSEDASLVLQKIIEQMPDNSSLHITAGTYEVRSIHIQGRNGITIFGDGERTVLRHANLNGNPDVVLFIGSHLARSVENEKITVKDLVIDGNYPAIAQGAGLDINGARDVLIKNVIFQNCGQRALRPCTWDEQGAPSYNVRIEDCYFDRTNVVLGGIDGGHMSNCTFVGTPTGNTIVDMSYGEQISSWLRDFWIVGCMFRDVSGPELCGGIAGFQFVRGGGIIGCSFENIGLAYSLVTFDPEPHHFLEDYVIANNHYTASGGILILSGERVSVIGNVIKDAEDEGIVIGEGCRDVVVRNNVVTGSWSNGVRIAADDCLIDNNTVKNNNRGHRNDPSHANVVISHNAIDVRVWNNSILDDRGWSLAIIYDLSTNISLWGNYLFSALATTPEDPPEKPPAEGLEDVSGATLIGAPALLALLIGLTAGSTAYGYSRLRSKRAKSNDPLVGPSKER